MQFKTEVTFKAVFFLNLYNNWKQMVENVPVTAFFSYSARVIQQCIMSFFF